MIVKLAITGASLLAFFAIWLLALFVGMAITDHSYTGKHR